MKIIFAHCCLFLNVQLIAVHSQSAESEVRGTDFSIAAINVHLSKRSGTEEDKEEDVFDKELNVSYLPSETHIATSHRSKLPTRKSAPLAADRSETLANAQQSKGSIVGDERAETLPPNYEYWPRKQASEYSQSRRAQRELKKLADMRQNDKTKYAEYLKASRIRKSRFTKRTKSNPEVQKRVKEYANKHYEKLKLMRQKVRSGTADEREKQIVVQIRQREKEHKAKTAKSKKSNKGAG